MTAPFRRGCEILNLIMRRHGFVFAEGASGEGSGGTFASGHYARGDRRLEFHFRSSLGLVTYHVGASSLDHGSYMRALLGRDGGNRYPGFSEDPLDGFRGLAFDLEHHCSDFLHGSGDQFRRCVKLSQERDGLSGFKQLRAD